MPVVLEHVGKLGNIVNAPKMFLNLLGNIFDSREANFVSATKFPGVGKLGNIDRKQNVSATMFPSFPHGLRIVFLILRKILSIRKSIEKNINYV